MPGPVGILHHALGPQHDSETVLLSRKLIQYGRQLCVGIFMGRLMSPARKYLVGMVMAMVVVMPLMMVMAFMVMMMAFMIRIAVMPMPLMITMAVVPLPFMIRMAVMLMPLMITALSVMMMMFMTTAFPLMMAPMSAALPIVMVPMSAALPVMIMVMVMLLLGLQKLPLQIRLLVFHDFQHLFAAQILHRRGDDIGLGIDLPDQFHGLLHLVLRGHVRPAQHDRSRKFDLV